MHSINSILVPVDFSKVSANAFRYALRLADSLDASIDLLHAVPSDDGSLISMSLAVQQVDLAKEKLEKFFTEGVTAVSGHLKHVPAISPYVKIGGIRAAIRKHVEAEDNNLIVMGTHSETKDLEGFFGTNTSQLVNKAPCPVLVVPEGFAFQPLQSVCYATDLSHLDAFQAGHLLRTLRVFEPRLDFVHVKTGKGQKTNFNMDLLREVFDRPNTGLDTRFHVLEDDDVAEEIFEFAEETKADLVVMHRPRHSWMSRLFGKSNTRDAVLEATVPLLILPLEKKDEEKALADVVAQQYSK
ncbi:universal stress protein [Neolewinella persica]|uniref:universal stress protein n=1 Tax=Neolewinella persica TaxID=70998 RepID=UPI0003A855BC|nr:universal stress protein [Neolewinella persica]